MNKWLEERYVLRSEHQEVVGYYRKLIAQLHVTIRDLRDRLDEQQSRMAPDGGEAPHAPARPCLAPTDWSRYGGNVVSLELVRRRGRGARGPERRP